MILVGLDEFRMNLGTQLGADVVVNASREDSVAIIQQRTGGIGADVVLEMSGSPKAMNESIDALRNGGRYCFFGIYKEDSVAAPLNKIIFKGGRFYGINGRIMFDTWYTVSNLLKSKRLDVSPVITHRLPLSKYNEAFDMLMTPGNKVGKIVLFPDQA